MKREGAIGIDVGGTKTLFTLFDSAFTLKDQIKVKTPKKSRSDFQRALLDSVPRKQGNLAADGSGGSCLESRAAFLTAGIDTK